MAGRSTVSSPRMKLTRTINYNFGWLVLVALVNIAFLLVFFSVAEFEFYFATRDFRFNAVLSFYAWPTN